MRAVVLSSFLWALIWGTGAAVWLSHGPKGGDSWVRGMPLYLPTAVAIWGTIRGAYATRNTGAIWGSLIGVLYGALVAIVGLAVFGVGLILTDGWVFKNVPPWCTAELVVITAGIIAGVIVGALSEVAWALNPL